MKILITGFEPFGGEKVNPSYETVKRLPDEINGCQIIKKEIPTVFEKAGNIVIEEIKKHKPDAVIMLGQAGGRTGITLEKVAINYMNASIEDNDGNKPIDETINSNGATAFFSTLPIREMKEAIVKEGIPASISFSAGTYVCNDTFYRVRCFLEDNMPEVKAGFIHVPYETSQVAAKGVTYSHMSYDELLKGIVSGINELVNKLLLES